MGNYLSNNTVLLAAKRVLGRYNIESRTFKEMEKQSQKPKVAPKHEAGIIDYHKSLSGKSISMKLAYFEFICFILSNRKYRIFGKHNINE